MKEIITPICSDHAGFDLKEALKNKLENEGYKFKDFGTFSKESVDYPDLGHQVAQYVEENAGIFGIVICGSGNGINMTVNKHKGIRGALCWNKEIAQLARLHNDANILALPGRFVSVEEGIEITKTFLSTDFEGGRHQKRIDKIAL